MHSVQAFTFLSLNNILMSMFNSHYILVKVISKQAVIIVSHFCTLQAILKQAAVMAFLSHLLLVLAPTFCLLVSFIALHL